MLFFGSVLLLWMLTVLLTGLPDSAVPPVGAWAIWTLCLYLCGGAALAEPFRTLTARLCGVLGYSMVVIYYIHMPGTYLPMMGGLPTAAPHPNLWPTVFLAVNLLGPLALITVGCLSPAVQRGDGRAEGEE